MAFNATAFLEALDEIEASKGISKETVLQGLKEAIAKAYKKELGGDDAEVRVTIDLDNNSIELCQLKNIVKNADDVLDDFLEVSEEEAKQLQKEGKGYIEDDKFVIPATVDAFRKAAALSVKSMMKQKFAEAEKVILYEAFKDKIGTMITGRVEKYDDRGISVNIVRSSVYLPKNQLIADEKFQVGDTIKLYVNSVEASTKGGARIVVTRSNEGFLKCLFFEEIHEIYDGTIIIKGIAREAGERSKVAVYSNDPNVDPAGACIGPNGSRIQKIVGQLGNGTSREKIDIIAYSNNPGMYIMEALKPAKVAGVIVSEENKTATVVVKDDSLSLAIGRKGVNARLAVKLTGYNIDIKTESEALEAGLTYQSYEELAAQEAEIRNKKVMELAAQARNQIMENILPGLPQGYVAPQERVYEDEESNEEVNEVLEAQLEKEEAVKVEEVKVEEAPVEEAAPVEEVKPEPAPAPVEAPKAEEPVEVKTTTSLEELEKNLASESNKSKKQTGKKFSRKKKDEDEEESNDSAKSTDTSNATRMAIYTEEELAEFEAEEQEAEEAEDDIDYDDYDEYYDDEN